MNLTKRKKFWYPVIGALIACVPYTIIAVLLWVVLHEKHQTSELLLYPLFVALIFGPSLWAIPCGMPPSFYGFLTQFLMYGVIIGVGWRANKLWWALLGVVIMHVGLSLAFLAFFYPW